MDEEISSVEEFERAFQTLLTDRGVTLVAPRHLALEAHNLRQESMAYDLEADAMVSDPFFHYVVDNGIAIFLIDGDPFLVFAFACDPHELITYVESDLPSHEVDACKEYVIDVLGKAPDIEIPADLAYAWMAAAT